MAERREREKLVAGRGAVQVYSPVSIGDQEGHRPFEAWGPKFLPGQLLLQSALHCNKFHWRETSPGRFLYRTGSHGTGAWRRLVPGGGGGNVYREWWEEVYRERREECTGRRLEISGAAGDASALVVSTVKIGIYGDGRRWLIVYDPFWWRIINAAAALPENI